MSSIAPILAIEIDLDAIQIVFLRCLIAFLVLTPFIFPNFFSTRAGRVLSYYDRSALLGILGTGILTAGYMVSFFATAKLANASISLIGFGSTSVWTTLLIPILSRSKKLNLLQLLLALVSVAGFFLIFKVTGLSPLEMLLSILTGVLGALTIVFNRYYSKFKAPFLITYIQLLSGLLVTGGIILFMSFSPVNKSFSWQITLMDLGFLLILSIGFSTLLYARFIHIMKKASVFLVSISSNLMPIYGMIAALLIVGKSEVMAANFYLGALLVIAPVLVYSFLRQTEKGKEVYRKIELKLKSSFHLRPTAE